MNKLRVLIWFLLFLFNMVTIYSQECYWHTWGTFGEVLSSEDYADTTGFSVGQNWIADLSEIGDSITYGFWYRDWDAVICYEISDSNWLANISEFDSLGYDTTVSMRRGEEIIITNCGNCHIDFGMKYVPELSDFVLQYSTDKDVMVVRAKFTHDSVCPDDDAYDFAYDYMKESYTWSNSLIFGSGGFMVIPTEPIYLWFQIITPTGLRHYVSGDPLYFTITINLVAKISLP